MLDKTIFIAEEDLFIFEKIQGQAGESTSKVIAHIFNEFKGHEARNKD